MEQTHKQTLTAVAVNLQSPTSCPRHWLLGSVSGLSTFDYRFCSYAPHGAQQSPSNIQRGGTGPGTGPGRSKAHCATAHPCTGAAPAHLRVT